MGRPRLANGWLNLALAGAGLAVLVLLYGLAARTFVPRTSPARETPMGVAGGDRIQIEVRNGAGVSGLAAAATSYLRARGFDVVSSGNHAPAEASYVSDRVGNPDYARRVAAALGLPPAAVRAERDATAFLDATVVLGRDYAALAPFRDIQPSRADPARADTALPSR